jgi:hypothetical protein
MMNRGVFSSGFSGLVVAIAASWLISCGGAETVEGPGALGPFTASNSDGSPTVASERGRLDNKDSMLDRGTYGDTYSFVGARGEPVRVSLESDDLDTYLYLYDATGYLVAEDDDSGSQLNSRLVMTLPDDGVFLVVVTSYGRETGDYTLEVERVANSGRYPLLSTPADVSRRFGAEARLNETGNPYHVYAVDLSAGAAVQMRMSSTDADSLLKLYDEQGHLVTEDDDSGGDLNALIRMRASSTQRYYLVATTYSPPRDWEAASYQLVVTE